MRAFDWIRIFFQASQVQKNSAISFSKFLSPHLLADVRKLCFKAYFDLMIYNSL